MLFVCFSPLALVLEGYLYTYANRKANYGINDDNDCIDMPKS